METRNAAAGAGVDSSVGQARPARKTLWAVQDKGGEPPPLVFVLAGYGDAWVAQGLARALGPEQRVYGLQPPNETTATTARELATLYVEQLRAVQPHGPYCLGGYSAGAVMALEVATQFRAQGEVVGLVALLDPLFIRYTRFEYLCYHALQRVCRAVEKILPTKLRFLQILAAMFEDKGLDIHLDALAGHKPLRMRIAVVAVGTRGDVEPHVALCQGLRQAGYDARLCAPDDFGPSFVARGIPFDPIPVSFRGLYQTSRGHALLASGANGVRFLGGLGRVAVDVAAQVIAGIRAACREADAVCYSPLGFPALYFAHEMGIPAFATSLQPLGRTGEHANPLLSLPGWMPSVINRFSYRLVEQVFWQVARPLLRPHVRDPPPVWGHFHDPDGGPGPPPVAHSPLVSPQPRDWKPLMHATGYLRAGPAARQPPQGLEEFLAAGPAVCIGFGSMHSPRIARILDTALDALARTGRRAVILTGWSGYAGRRAGEDGTVVVTGDAPHDLLFPRVSGRVHPGCAR